MADCEMPFSTASFLKAASQGSNAPVLRQLAWPNAAVGAALSRIAANAQTVWLACILVVRVVRMGLRLFSTSTAALIAPGSGRGASCSYNGNSLNLHRKGDCDPATAARGPETTHFRQHHDVTTSDIVTS